MSDSDLVEFESVIDHCKKLVAANEHAYVDSDALWVARFVLKTLGAALPDGVVPPPVKWTARGTVVTIDAMEISNRDEALGLAAAIVRGALELPDEDEHHCGQCGWSGTSFHACPGLPGENEF